MVKKIGPYRVEQRLGVGGMGEVYKAYDDRLDRWVAIKRIRPDKEGADDNRERFQREARATAKLNHSSIVHLYDIFLDGDSDCIVMEYVEGRTLDTLVMEGPLEPSLTMRLGLEIASGLAEAHSKGIIHRDLKVENIILTPEGHAKILDFGLAKPILSNELDTSLTGKGQLVGTSRAMSPEYVSGEEIDHRSDLFSLGVLLYESATGHSPFKAHNTLATLKQVMLHSQTPACQVHSRVPVELSELIDRLLEKDPEDRPQSSEEIVEIFQHMTSHLSSSSTVARPGASSTAVHPAPPPGSFSASATAIEQLSQRPYLWALIPLLLVIAALAAWSFQPPEPLVTSLSGHNAPDDWNPVVRESIVIADFENKTGEPLLDDTLGFAFRLGLEQSRVAQALSPSQVSAALARMELPEDTPIDRNVGQEIVQREGAKALVIGSIIKIIDSYQLSGTVLDPKGTTTFARSVDAGSPEEIVGALNTLTQEIRTNLGESLGSIRQANSLDKVTTSDLEALQAYSLGVARQADGKFEEATSFFKVALEQDPEFAMAHGKLAAIYIGALGDYEQGLQHLDRALALTDRLTRYEELYLRGWEARLRESPEEIVSIWTRMSTLFPEVQVGHRNAGMAYLVLFNKYEDAATYFARAVEVSDQGNRPDANLRLGQSQMALGRLDEALESFKRSGNLVSFYWGIDYFLVAGNLAEAQRQLEQQDEVSTSDGRWGTEVRWATLETDKGNLPQAMVHARNAESLEDRAEEYELAARLAVLALAEWGDDFESELETSLAAAFEAIEREERRAQTSTPRGVHQLPFAAVATIGKLCARSGSLDDAVRLLERLEPLARGRDLPIWTSHLAMLEAEIALREGQPTVAIRRLREALNSTRFFQFRESLARALLAANQLSDAEREYRWMLAHKGRALVECRRGCQALSVLDWHYAQRGLGQTLAAQEKTGEAQTELEVFSQWSHADAAETSESPPPRLRPLL